MDAEKIQDRYRELYEQMNSSIVLVQEASREVRERYINVRNEMILLGFNRDFQTERINFAKTQKGKDLLILWEDADRRYTVAVANMHLAEFNIRYHIACVNSGIF